MKLAHTEEKTVEETVTDDILCNQCGGSLKDDCDMNYEGLIEIAIRGGYAAKLGDQVVYEFSICEDCLQKMFDGFAIPPLRWDNMAPFEENEAAYKALLEKVEELRGKHHGSG